MDARPEIESLLPNYVRHAPLSGDYELPPSALQALHGAHEPLCFSSTSVSPLPHPSIPEAP